MTMCMNERSTLSTVLFAVCRPIAAMLMLLSLLIFQGGTARADIPDELYKALSIGKDATPQQLYDALVKRYYDPNQGAGKGKFGHLWEPIPMTKYFMPHLFYTPPDVAITATRQDCVECHTSVTPGWVHSWKKSVHNNLEEIRNLPNDDSRAYKKELIGQVEANLRSLGKLRADEPLKEVGCIDCHIGVNAERGNHRTELRMPDAAACGQCHIQQFAERESERDTQSFPQGQWPSGQPSHALSMHANVETGIWAGMQQREVAEGCTMCHTAQNTCNTCHTRHEFSVAAARKPETCSYCHNGVDHNEFENYMLSKHGINYATKGSTWDWEKPLSAGYAAANQTAPTCQTCHFEFNGQFSHNLVRKVRWGFAPTKAIADNLEHPWFKDRKEAWIQTCSQCHSGRFAGSYLDMVDKGTIDGVKLVEEARAVVKKLYDDGLLVGQKTNRPAPPTPEKDGPGEFFHLFFTKGNNGTAVDLEFAKMWEQHIMMHFKGLAHVNPGGFTYTNGWSNLVRSLAVIRDADTQLREKAAIEARIAKLEARTSQRRGFLDLESPLQRAGGVGFGLLLAGAGLATIFGPRRRKSEQRPAERTR
jgi:hydroxylamine dehydrogenase